MTAATVQLKYPITIDGQKVAAVTLRRPKVRDLVRPDRAGASDEDREILLLADLTSQTPDALRELDLADYTALQQAYQDFFEVAPSGAKTTPASPQR